MIKEKIIIFVIFIILQTSAFSADISTSSSKSKSDGRDDDTNLIAKKSKNFIKALNLIKRGKKYNKKGKTEQASEKFEKAIQYLLLSRKVAPNNPDVLKYLGFTYKMLGDFTMAEIYYLEGLEINPTHNGLNEYLGKLFLQTNRINKANERLEVLENCKCEEFEELNIAIKKGVSKY